MAKRGIYVVKLDLGQPHLAGVADKIRAQASALEALPARIDLYHLSGGAVVLNGTPIASAGSGKLARRIAHYLLFHLALARHREPLDFIYMRHQGASPMLLLALAMLRWRHPGLAVVVEFPSWPYDTEARTLREKFLRGLDRLSRKYLRRVVDRILTFSREGEILGIRTIQTDNGVDLARFTLLPKKVPDGKLRLLGLANLSFWHGYDRVIDGIAAYYAGGGKVDIQFDVVGVGSELPRLKALAERHDLVERVHFHGLRRGAELEAIMARADIGISSIGMHRLEVDTSNLKSREFCARGLPFVIGYDDRDFPPGTAFAHQVPADDSAVKMDALLAFHHGLHSVDPDYRVAMREFAERRLGWTVKMDPALAEIRELLGARQ